MTGYENGMNMLVKIEQAFWTVQGVKVPEVPDLPTFSHEHCPVRTDIVDGREWLLLPFENI